MKKFILKSIKLLLVAITTLVFCIGVLYVIDREKFYYNYRCWQRAAKLSSCFRPGHFDFVVDLNGVRYEGNTGNFIDTHIFFYGAYEKSILFFLRDTMASAYGSQGIFLDIGANTGQHSLFMSRHATQIHAFEPWEPVVKRFRSAVEKNGLKNIVIHPFGLGSENSRKPFYKPPESNLVTGSFVENFQEHNSYEGELEIQIGDDALKKNGVKSVALVKMDIEGYEKLALMGLRKTLSEHRPIVEFELTIDPKNAVSIKSKTELTDLFPANYEFLVISRMRDPSTGLYFLQPIAEIVRFDVPEQHDVVAFPTEKKDKLPLKGPRI
jgi:FkbM family methyltransferase